MYRERAARPAGAVMWTRTAAGGPERVLPDGCTDLIWCDSGSAGKLIVAGPDTVAQFADAPPGTRFTGLRFAPGTGPAVFGVPADELRDLRVPLDALWPAGEVRRLTGALLEAREAGQAAAERAEGLRGNWDGGGARQAGGTGGLAGVLEEAALARLRAAPPPDPVIAEVLAGLAGGAPVAAVAARVGLSERQLHRRSRAAFGYGPKALARVLRLNRALTAARAGRPYAEVAAACGYADQAHLAREVRALTGVPLGQLTGPVRQPAGASGAKRSTPLPSGS